MGKILRFLRIFTVFVGSAICGGAYAGDYDCPELKTYSSCSAGYYMTLNGEYNATPTVGNTCTACPSDCVCAGGTTNAVCGKTCEAGKFWSGTSCQSCRPRYYCPGFTEAIFDYTTIYGRESCPTAEEGWLTTTSSTGAALITDCYERRKPDGCDSGYVKKQFTGTADNPSWGAEEIQTALKAEPGYIVSGLTCQICPAGTVSTGGEATTCTPCESGKYSQAGASLCLDCPAGHACPNGVDTECPAGKYPNADKTACIDCPAGQICNDGVPEDCPDGTYPNAEKTQCLTCPAGKICTGGTPQDCPAGQMPNADKTQCVSCTSGKICTDGVPEDCPAYHVPNASQTECIINCAAGQYYNGTICTACPTGAVSAGGNVTQCQTCATGTMVSTDLSQCLECPSTCTCVDPANPICQTACEYNQYWDGAKCTQCDEHYTSNGGMVTSCVPMEYDVYMIPMGGRLEGLPSNAQRVRLKETYGVEFRLAYGYSGVTYDDVVTSLPKMSYDDGRHFVGWFTEENGQGDKITNVYGEIIVKPTFFKSMSSNIYSYGECNVGYHFDEDLQTCVHDSCATNHYWNGTICAPCDEHYSSSGGDATSCTPNTYNINMIPNGTVKGLGSGATRVTLAEVYNTEFRLQYYDTSGGYYDDAVTRLPTISYDDGRHFVGWFTEDNGKGEPFTDQYGNIEKKPTFFTEMVSTIYSYGECSIGYRFDEDQQLCVAIQTSCDVDHYWDGAQCAHCPEHQGSDGGMATSCKPNAYTIRLMFDYDNGYLSHSMGDNHQIYEIYGEKYAVSFNAGVTFSELDSIPTVSYRNGQKFRGWYTQPDGKGVRVVDANGTLPSNTYFTQSSILYAYSEADCEYDHYWDGAQCAQCDEHYMSNGGNVTACTPRRYTVYMVPNGELVGIPSNATRVRLEEVYNTEFRLSYYASSEVNDVVTTLPTIKYPDSDGRHFVGWFTEENGGYQIAGIDGKIKVKPTFFTEISSNIYSRGECALGWEFDEGKQTCIQIQCDAGQYWNWDTLKCAQCPSGYTSNAGAEEQTACYIACEEYPIEGGTAVPVAPTANYPAQCQYKGVSDSGGTCEIIDGKCVLNGCLPEYELIGGTCVPCNRDGAEAYKKTGNCQIERCRDGMHPNGDRCDDNVRECTVPNALAAAETWDFAKKGFTACMPTECKSGYHVEGYSCVLDEQACKIEHGVGVQQWDYAKGLWGECVATSCDPGYTNDLSETSEPTKQCGTCKNRFSLAGEVAARYGSSVQAYNDNQPAASSYVRGCEIATCMYQGKKYALEDNFCRPICTPGADETGSKQWTGSECRINCNEGYTTW